MSWQCWRQAALIRNRFILCVTSNKWIWDPPQGSKSSEHQKFKNSEEPTLHSAREIKYDYNTVTDSPWVSLVDIAISTTNFEDLLNFWTCHGNWLFRWHHSNQLLRENHINFYHERIISHSPLHHCRLYRANFQRGLPSIVPKQSIGERTRINSVTRRRGPNLLYWRGRILRPRLREGDILKRCQRCPS